MHGTIASERLQSAMDERGIDQSELARRVGCSSAAINQIVMGKTQRSRYMPAIAHELRVSLRWLMGESDQQAEVGGAGLSSEEERLLFSWRRLNPEQKRSVQHILDSMITNGSLHSRRHDYRAG
jgi:transcriptional regulator with XRE-family HTH domain